MSTPTPSDITPLTQQELDALLAQYGVPPTTTQVPKFGPPAHIDLYDPSVIAAAEARKRADRTGKPISQFVTTGGEPIAQLFDELDTLKPQLDNLEPRVKELKNRIKAMLRQLDPRSPKIQIYRAGQKNGYELRNVPKILCNMNKLKEEFPAAYAACTYESDQWSLYAIK